ncbi:hypothetical protein [Blastococcus deserti]|uniref:Uncharacterized protein n=1 Tax=Blastococcus deserti TaxID=2259033 RepID=A0ABW4X5J4_9ACTN
MKRPLRALSVSTALAAAAVTGLAAAPSAGAHDSPGHRPSAGPRAAAGEAELASVRAATARYHRVEAALADGYRPSPECAASPDGVMGVHYVNPARLGSIDPRRPAILLYVPTENGPRLAGVEYFQADADQDPTTDDDRPSLFGQPFDGPMPGHEPGMPVHYDLHVWLWAHNPAGTFAPWNPALSC